MNEKRWTAKHFGQKTAVSVGRTMGPKGYVFIALDDRHGHVADWDHLMQHMTPDRARKIAHRLLEQADKAESEAGQ